MLGPDSRPEHGPRPRFRRRDDYAVELFRDIQAHLDDTPRVSRALLELARFYNPLVNGPIVDLPTRRRVVELLERNDQSEARRILDQRLRLYAKSDDRESEVEDGSPPGDANGGIDR